MVIFRYFPGIVFLMIVLSVYILGRREGFGWGAALFTCLIPTTVGIMGPAFLCGLGFSRALVSITAGVIISGAIVTALSLMGWFGAIIAGLGLSTVAILGLWKA